MRVAIRFPRTLSTPFEWPVSRGSTHLRTGRLQEGEEGASQRPPRTERTLRGLTVRRVDEIREQLRRVRRAETRDRIPTLRRRVARDARVALVVVLDAGDGRVRDVEVVGRVHRRIRGDLVQRRIDWPEAGLAVLLLIDLVGDRDQARPLRAAERGPADVVPAGLVDVAAVAVRRQREVYEGARGGARLERDIRNPAARGGDRGATSGKLAC